MCEQSVCRFFFNDTTTTEIYTLSLTRRSSDLEVVGDPVRDRLDDRRDDELEEEEHDDHAEHLPPVPPHQLAAAPEDRKSTRLNSSHANISYAVFCLKKKITCSAILSIRAPLKT